MNVTEIENIANFRDAHKIQLLLKTYDFRANKNPMYSKRAFAKSLEVSHSFLFAILKGRRKAPNKVLEKIYEKPQGLNKNDIDALKFYISDKTYQSISLASEDFALVSSWKKFALLNLIQLENALWDSSWLSKSLNIAIDEVEKLMEVLEELNYVSVIDERPIRNIRNLSYNNKNQDFNATKFNRDLIEKSIDYLDHGEFSKRSFRNIFFKMSPEIASYARERIKKFEEELSQDLEILGGEKEVYVYTSQLFPLTETNSTGIPNEKIN